MLGILGTYDIYSPLPYDNATTVTHDFDRGPDFHSPCQGWDRWLNAGSKMVMSGMVDMRNCSGAKPREEGSA
jgi:hypothetical protein